MFGVPVEINVADVTDLRTKLISAEVEYKVIKNNITRRALENCGIKELDDVLEGPTAVIIGNKDYLDACKIVYKYAKEKGYKRIITGVSSNNIQILKLHEMFD